MKKLALPLLLFLTSCTWLKESTVALCDANDKVTAGITDVGGWFGSPGTLVAGGLNMLLDFACSIVVTTASVPQNLTDMVTGVEVADPAADTPDGQ